MKKYIALLFLLAIKITCTMDLVPFQELSGKQDEQCYWVAQYLCKRSDALNGQEKELVTVFFQKKDALSVKVQEYQQSINESDEESITFLTKFLYYEANTSDYLNLSSGALYRVEYFLDKNFILAYIAMPMKNHAFRDVEQYSTDMFFKIEKSTRHVLTDAYMRMYARADGIKYKEAKRQLPKIISLAQLEFLVRRDEDPTIDGLEFDCSQKDAEGLPKFRIFEEIFEDFYKIPCNTFFLIKAMPYESLLSTICEKSTECSKRCGSIVGHQLTSTDIKQLHELHKKVDQNEAWQALQNVAIDIDFSAQTEWETVKNIGNYYRDKLLLAIPLFLVEGLIPTGIVFGIQKAHLGTILSGLTHCLGFASCIYVNRLIGRDVYPFFDSYNSGVCKLRSIFGENGVRKIQRPYRFMIYGGLHYLATIVSQFFLYSQGLRSILAFTGENASHYLGYVCSGLGVTLYFCRLLGYLYNVMSTKYSDKDGDREFFGKMAYHNPLLRRNKEGKYFTLGDLVKK